MVQGVSSSIQRVPHVLQVVLSLNPGGTERLVVEIVRRLRSELPMAVCCLDDEGSWGDELRREGIHITALRRGTGFRPLLGRDIARFAAANDVDVVHCHHYSPFVYSSVARVWRPHMQVIFTEHGRLSDAPPSTKRRFANRILRRTPYQVVTVSADLRRHLIAEGFSEAHVGVVYNGIQVRSADDGCARACARRMLTIGDDTIVVGTIARLDPVKDLDMLVRACAKLQDRLLTTLVVIGDGSERHRLEQLAAELGVDTRFLGHRDDARRLLAGCDIYANSSIHEGISLTILEAMAAKLPVVATSVGGTPEIIDRACGRLVPPRDPDQMAGALNELASDRTLREDLGRVAQQRVDERFTIERMVAEYRAAYYGAVSARRTA
jgi:L-malate glycosyltransferase